MYIKLVGSNMFGSVQVSSYIHYLLHEVVIYFLDHVQIYLSSSKIFAFFPPISIARIKIFRIVFTLAVRYPNTIDWDTWTNQFFKSI